jgi:NTE family protein
METRPYVLSGGGARGIAHLGVVKALTNAGISPSAISGTSAGALVGAFLAAGASPDAVLQLLLKDLQLATFRLNALRGRLISSKRISDVLKANLPERFEDLGIPLFVSATDLEKGGQRIFNTGELLLPLMAASAVPVVFPNVRIGGTAYVDGGLSNNLPIEPFNERRGEVIAVYVNPLPPYDPKRSLRRTLDRTFHLSFREMVARSAQGCHVFIEPPALAKYGMFDLGFAKEIFEVGYRYTSELLAKRTT